MGKLLSFLAGTNFSLAIILVQLGSARAAVVCGLAFVFSGFMALAE